MNLEQAWKQDEEQVDALIKSAKKYVGALKAWKKASQFGHVANRNKAAALAIDLADALGKPTSETASAFTFDVRAYLEGDAWRKELRQLAEEQAGLRILEADETLLSSPVIVRSLPSRNLLQLGKTNWPNLRPTVVVSELKKLRERAAGTNSVEFLESLYATFNRFMTRPEDVYMRFRDIYAIFSLTPGWKKDNPPVAFGQAIYGLHRSDVKVTRGGKAYEFIYPSGTFKETDIFSVVAEDGRTLRYLGIRFF